jgi:putative transcriptional regulator
MDNRIKVLRAEKDWSQQTLAQRIGVSRQAVNAVERGKHDPSLQLAFDIAGQFEQRIEDIFFPEKKSNSEAVQETKNID